MRKPTTLSNIINRSQLSAMLVACKGEESAWFQAKLAELEHTFATMHSVAKSADRI